jgi:hypothetical protein
MLRNKDSNGRVDKMTVHGITGSRRGGERDTLAVFNDSAEGFESLKL